MNEAELRQQIKNIMVENLMLKVAPSDIGDDQPLFGPGSLGLDKNFGLKIPDAAKAKETLQSVSAMAKAVQDKQAAG
jgi:acyl carrier protein